METKERFHLIEKISEINAHGHVFIATKADESREFAVVKIPKNVNDAKDLFTEYCVMDALGSHVNLIKMIEYTEKEPCYMALQFAKAKCLFNYLATMNATNTQNEKWARYFFKQIVTALAHMHEKEVAHLDLKIDNILLDFDQASGKLTALVADFGMA